MIVMFSIIGRLALVLCVVALVALPVVAGDDRTEIPTCKYCGMDRVKFEHSRMHIVYADGSSTGTCSLHCAAIDLAVNMGSAPSQINVADYGSKQLVNAETAFWVIGGDQKGVMTKNAKWAFESKEAAEKFIGEHGGSVATFEEAIQKSYAEMYDDTKMIRKMRQEKMKKMNMMEEEKKKKATGGY